MRGGVNVRGKLVAITGIGGFIGLRLAEVFRDAGATVRGLELQGAAAARARAGGFEVLDGDVTMAQHAKGLVRGADVVLHTAAIVGEGGDLERLPVGRAHACSISTVFQLSTVGGALLPAPFAPLVVYFDSASESSPKYAPPSPGPGRSRKETHNTVPERPVASNLLLIRTATEGELKNMLEP